MPHCAHRRAARPPQQRHGPIPRPAPPPRMVVTKNKKNRLKNGKIFTVPVTARPTDKPRKAGPPGGGAGTSPKVAPRHNMTMTWGHTFQDAFDTVKAKGDGTIAIVGIAYSGGTASHVVTMANDHGHVLIFEGQNWGAGNPQEIITSPGRANQRYNSDGGSNVGYGIVRTGR